MPEPNSARVPLGRQACLYINLGTYAEKEWTLIHTKDLTCNPDKTETEVTDRESEEHALFQGLHINSTIEFTVNAKKTLPAAVRALETSQFSFTDVEIMCLSGPRETPGSRGLVGFFEVMGFQRNEPIGGVQDYNVRMRPCRHQESDVLVKPTWHIVPETP